MCIPIFRSTFCLIAFSYNFIVEFILWFNLYEWKCTLTRTCYDLSFICFIWGIFSVLKAGSAFLNYFKPPPEEAVKSLHWKSCKFAYIFQIKSLHPWRTCNVRCDLNFSLVNSEGHSRRRREAENFCQKWTIAFCRMFKRYVVNHAERHIRPFTSTIAIAIFV